MERLHDFPMLTVLLLVKTYCCSLHSLHVNGLRILNIDIGYGQKNADVLEDTPGEVIQEHLHTDSEHDQIYDQIYC